MLSTPSDTQRRTGRSWVPVAVPVLVLVLIAIGLTLRTAAPAHQLSAAAAGTVAQGQADPQVAVIQAVIQQGNQEQAAALANKNPSLMSGTATATYYRQLVQVNQALAAQGATSIGLIRLDCRPINVTATGGRSATVQRSEGCWSASAIEKHPDPPATSS